MTRLVSNVASFSISFGATLVCAQPAMGSVNRRLTASEVLSGRWHVLDSRDVIGLETACMRNSKVPPWNGITIYHILNYQQHPAIRLLHSNISIYKRPTVNQ